MPRIDFPNVDDMADYEPVPDGQYLCRLADIEPEINKFGDDMWKLRWEIESGKWDGRILFEYLVFSSKAMPRVKILCECCGIDVSEELELEPSMLLDKRVFVDTYTETKPDDKGQEKKYNNIPFKGYHPVTGDEDEPPF